MYARHAASVSGIVGKAKLSEARLSGQPNSVKGFVSPTFAFGGQNQEIDAVSCYAYRI